MNQRMQINRLQNALISKGKLYKINTYQFFSEEQSRMITGYRVTEKVTVKKPNGDIKSKERELVNTCSQIELLKWFVKEWEAVKDT